MGSWFQVVTTPLFVPPQETFSFDEVATCPLASQILYSSYHNALFVRSPHTIYKVSLNDNHKDIFYASSEYEFKWMDISKNGELLFILTSESESSIKIFHRNLFNILAEVTSTQSVPTVAKFVSNEMVVGCATNEQTGMLRFLSINFSSKLVKQNTVPSTGRVLNLMQLGDDMFVAVTHNGELYSVIPSKILEDYSAEDVVEYSSSSSSIQVTEQSSLSLTESGASQSDSGGPSSSSVLEDYIGVKLEGIITSGVVAAELAGRKMSVTDARQKKIRVFVGSQKWSNDRWDSGEIETDKTKIAYGGGNNLEPGQKYYAHILVNYENGAWAAPQVHEFVVPKY